MVAARKTKEEIEENKNCITNGPGGTNDRLNPQRKRGIGTFAATYLYLDCVQLTQHLYAEAADRKAKHLKAFNVVFCLTVFLETQGFSFWQKLKGMKAYEKLEFGDEPTKKTPLREKVESRYRNTLKQSTPPDKKYAGRQEAADNPPKCIKDANLERTYAEMVNILWDVVQEYNENSNRLESGVRYDTPAAAAADDTTEEPKTNDPEESHVNDSGVCHGRLPEDVAAPIQLPNVFDSTGTWSERNEEDLDDNNSHTPPESRSPNLDNGDAKGAAQTAVGQVCNHGTTLAADKDEIRTKTPDSSVDTAASLSLQSGDNEDCGTASAAAELEEYEVLKKYADELDAVAATPFPFVDSLTLEQHGLMQAPLPDVDNNWSKMAPEKDEISTKKSESSVDSWLALPLTKDNEERSAVAANKPIPRKEDQGPTQPSPDSSVDLSVNDHDDDDGDAKHTRKRLQDEMDQLVDKYGYEKCLEVLERSKRRKSLCKD